MSPTPTPPGADSARAAEEPPRAELQSFYRLLKTIASFSKAMWQLAHAREMTALKHELEGVCFKAEVHEEMSKSLSSLLKATYARTVAKLFPNGLLGRNNMKLDRAQTLITRCPNDIVCLRADGQAFRSVQIQDIQCWKQ